VVVGLFDAGGVSNACVTQAQQEKVFCCWQKIWVIEHFFDIVEKRLKITELRKHVP